MLAPTLGYGPFSRRTGGLLFLFKQGLDFEFVPRRREADGCEVSYSPSPPPSATKTLHCPSEVCPKRRVADKLLKSFLGEEEEKRKQRRKSINGLDPLLLFYGYEVSQ
jgi:hypothetical protein